MYNISLAQELFMESNNSIFLGSHTCRTSVLSPSHIVLHWSLVWGPQLGSSRGNCALHKTEIKSRVRIIFLFAFLGAMLGSVQWLHLALQLRNCSWWCSRDYMGTWGLNQVGCVQSKHPFPVLLFWPQSKIILLNSRHRNQTENPCICTGS